MADTTENNEEQRSVFSDPVNGHVETANPAADRTLLGFIAEMGLLSLQLPLNEKDYPDQSGRYEFFKDVYGLRPSENETDLPLSEKAPPVSNYQRGKNPALEDIYNQAEALMNGASYTAPAQEIDNLDEHMPSSAPAAAPGEPADPTAATIMPDAPAIKNLGSAFAGPR